MRTRYAPFCFVYYCNATVSITWLNESFRFRWPWHTVKRFKSPVAHSPRYPFPRLLAKAIVRSDGARTPIIAVFIDSNGTNYARPWTVCAPVDLVVHADDLPTVHTFFNAARLEDEYSCPADCAFPSSNLDVSSSVVSSLSTPRLVFEERACLKYSTFIELTR